MSFPSDVAGDRTRCSWQVQVDRRIAAPERDEARASVRGEDRDAVAASLSERGANAARQCRRDFVVLIEQRRGGRRHERGAVGRRVEHHHLGRDRDLAHALDLLGRAIDHRERRARRRGRVRRDYDLAARGIDADARRRAGDGERRRADDFVARAIDLGQLLLRRVEHQHRVRAFVERERRRLAAKAKPWRCV